MSISKKENTIVSPFGAAYWKSAVGEFQNLKTITFTALMIAVSIVISALFIPIADNLRIYFSFLAHALCSLVGGPLIGLCAGAIGDILGYIIHPSGAFFPGYMLSGMLGYLVFALFLYRSRVTVCKIFIARLCINLFINVGLGSLWSAMLYGKGYLYYAATSIVKNLIMLPIEVLLLVGLLQMLLPVMARMGLASAQPKKRIPFR